MDDKRLITNIFPKDAPFLFKDCGKPGTASWLRGRKGTIGGSDAAAIMGLHPYSTAMDVYVDKTTADAGEPMNEKMEWGLRHEAAMRQAFAEKIERPVVSIQAIMYSNPPLKFPFDISRAILHANVDAIVLDEDGWASAILELKTTSQYSDSWNSENQYPGWLDQEKLKEQHPIDNEVPLWAWLQVQQNMLVTGLDMGYVALLRGGSEFSWYPVLKHQPTHDIIVYAAQGFLNHVEQRHPPKVDPAHPKSRDSIKTQFGEVNADDVVSLSEKLGEDWKRLEAMKAERKALDTEIKTIENRVYAEIGNAEFGVFPWHQGGYIRRKLVKTKGYWRPESESIRFYPSKKPLKK